MAAKLPISIAIITHNEEKNLPACLESVSFADDVVVVDSGSTDDTTRIAREFSARVFVEKWKGFGPQKNSAIQKCKNRWVFILDADERIPAETQRELRAIMASRDSADGYSFPRKNFFHGRWIKHSDWWPDRSTRLVKKERGYLGSVTHERWVSSGTIKEAKCPIEHHSYADYADMLKRLNAYSTLLAEELFRSGKTAGPLTPVSRGIGMFLKIYLLKKGFLDGFNGLVISLTKAGGSFFKYAKLRELWKNKK